MSEVNDYLHDENSNLRHALEHALQRVEEVERERDAAQEIAAEALKTCHAMLDVIKQAHAYIESVGYANPN